MKFDVMKPKQIDAIPENEDYTKYVYEIKYDGGSGIIIKKDNNVEIYHNDNSTPRTFRYPELTPEILQFMKDGTYIAELIVSTPDMLGGNFDLFQRRQVENHFKIERRKTIYPITAIIYDIVEQNGQKLTDLTLLERKRILTNNICDSNHIKLIESFDKPDKILSNKNKYEGIVIKDLNSCYSFGKRTGWFKKRFNREEIQKFVDYEDTETGIVLLTEKNKRVNLAGKRSEIAKQKIIDNGFVNCELSYNKQTDKGFRICSVKRIID